MRSCINTCLLVLHLNVVSRLRITDVFVLFLSASPGRTVLTNAISTHEPNRLLGFACVVHHIGLIGDLIRQCELNRWMGPARYAGWSL